MAEDAAMEEARDEYGRLKGEVHTSGRLRGADMLDASEAASSLFALQQILQRDDAPATTKALRALTNGIRSRDENAKQTCQAWAQSSPRLAELFHAYSAPGGRDADAKSAACFRTLATMLPLLPKPDAMHCWALAAKTWGLVRALRSSRHKDSRRAALEALEKGALCGTGSQQVLRWLGEDEKTWLSLCGARGKDGTRSKCARVMSAVARSGSKDERRDACKLLLPALLKGLEEDAPRDVHLLLSALRPERDDVHVVTALSSVDGAKALRVVAAYLRSSRKDDPGASKAAKVARTWLCVLTARHDDVRRALTGSTRPGHRRVLRALDPSCASQRAALELALKAAPPLLIDVLKEGAPGYLGRPRPWDAGASDRSRAGASFLASLLRATSSSAGPYDRSKRERDTAQDVVQRCLPPEGALTRKELGRGLRGQASSYALDLVDASLQRFHVEREAAVQLYGGCDHCPGERPPVKEILECCTRLIDDPEAAENYWMPPHRRRQLAGRFLDYECRRQMADRLPDVQALVQLLPKTCDETTPRVLDALIAYARELPEALAKGRFDACKFLVNALKWPNETASKAVAFCSAACLERLTHPTDTSAVKGRDALFDTLHGSTGALKEALRDVCRTILAKRGLDEDQTYEWLDALSNTRAGAPLGRCLDALARAPELLADLTPSEALRRAPKKKDDEDPFAVVAQYIDRREGRAPPPVPADDGALFRTAVAEDDAALNEVLTRVGVDLLMRGASTDVPVSLVPFRDALHEGRAELGPSLPFTPSTDLSRVASLLKSDDNFLDTLDSLVSDAPLARAGALCEALATAITSAARTERTGGAPGATAWCTGAPQFGDAQIKLAERALRSKPPPDLVARLDAALFAHDADVDPAVRLNALRTFFANGGDGPHARRAAEALSEADAATLGDVPCDLRAVLVKRCPQLADGVIEDEDALREVLRAWTENASNDACVAANATRCALLATDSVIETAVSRASTKGADMLLAACVRAGREISYEESGPRLAESLCATDCDNEFARSSLPISCASHLDDAALCDAALARLEDAPPLSWSSGTIQTVVTHLEEDTVHSKEGLRWVARVATLATGALQRSCRDFLNGASTDHVERALLTDAPIDEALLLGDVRVSEDVVTKALSRSPSVNTLRALKFTRASEDYLAKALEDEDLRKHALLLLDDHEDALVLALKHYGGTLSSTDKAALDILNKRGCTVDGPELQSWASSRNAAGPLWPLHVFDSNSIARTASKFPLSRSAVADENEECTDQGIDPRFLLPALFSCLSECTSTKAAAAKTAHESGIASYCLAALASRSPATRNYAFGCLDLIGTYAKFSEAQEDPQFRGRKAFCLLLDGVRGGAASKRGGFEDGVVPQFPCLAARVASAVCEALQDPNHPGYAASHQYVLRRSKLRPWQDAPLLKEALRMPDTCKVPAFVAFTPSEKLLKKTRRWAMALLVEGCRDDESGRLLRDAHALPLLMAHYDALRTGGFDPVEGKLTFLGEVPPGAKGLLDQPAYKLRRAVKDVRQASNDALRLLDALLTTKPARRSLFHQNGLTSWARIHLSHQKFDDEGKNYEWCSRLIRWMAILYDSQIKHERVLEDAPLFFVDLDKCVRGMMDCLCDADLARVGFERPKFRSPRKAPLDTLGILHNEVEDPNKRMSASERRRMEARDVWSEDELEYPEVPEKRDLDDVEASIKRGRAEAKRRKDLAALDRSDTESTASEASVLDDAKVECFARADELLLVDYFCQHARPSQSEGTAAGLLLNEIEPKDAYFYVFGVEGTKKISGFDDAVLALYLTQRMRVHPVPDIGDVLLKDTDWSQSPVLKGIYDSMRHDVSTEAARAADLALDNQDLRAVVVFIVETLVLDEDVARSCLGRRSLVAACRFLATYAQTVDGRVWRFTDQAKRVAKLRAATGPGCGRFGVQRSADASKYGSLVEARLAGDQNGSRRGAAFVCDELLAAALSDFTCDEWPDDGAVLAARAPEAPDAVAEARGALLRAAAVAFP